MRRRGHQMIPPNNSFLPQGSAVSLSHAIAKCTGNAPDSRRDSQRDTAPTIMNDAQKKRLLAETQETAARLNKLNAFMASDAFPSLDRADKDLLYSQQRVMSKYVQLLGKRLERAGTRFDHPSPPPPLGPKPFRAKFQVVASEDRSHDDDGNVTQESIQMSAVTDADYGDDGKNEDNEFARWTPSGELRFSITNPALIGSMEVGQKFYMDFTPAD